MTKWVMDRMEINTAGPILGIYQVTMILEDVDAPGNHKYEVRSVSAADLASNPDLILQTMQTDGYTPNDFGLAP